MTVVVAYDPSWPEHAEQARQDLLAALPGVFEQIEHVGSTSVPGLAAKPVIDLMASIGALTDTPVDALARLDYQLLDAGMTGRLFFFRDTGDRRTHHLHVVPAEGWEHRNERLLRDHLREHSEDARAYGELKERLAAEGLAGEAYTRAKTDLIQRFTDEARASRGLPSVSVWED
jgi:GrpB-like predicted nucleotidyltransferase (UPF0157 family)